MKCPCCKNDFIIELEDGPLLEFSWGTETSYYIECSNQQCAFSIQLNYTMDTISGLEIQEKLLEMIKVFED